MSDSSALRYSFYFKGYKCVNFVSSVLQENQRYFIIASLNYYKQCYFEYWE